MAERLDVVMNWFWGDIMVAVSVTTISTPGLCLPVTCSCESAQSVSCRLSPDCLLRHHAQPSRTKLQRRHRWCANISKGTHASELRATVWVYTLLIG